MISTQLLQSGDDRFETHRFGRGRIGDLLGSGTQGEVYAFTRDAAAAGPSSLAIKWYKPGYLRQDPELGERLMNLIERGSPGSNYLWPLDLAEHRRGGVEGFGYVMERCEPRFRKIRSLLHGKVQMSFRIVATAGYNLVRSFSLLHASGLCYFDISDGNVCVDPYNGDVAILDCDNVTVNGGASPIDGTPLFMAPELVRGCANPRKETDLHSLAALLFLLLVKDHPLLGARETGIIDDALWHRLLGDDPLFVYDPADTSNAPIPGFHENLIRNWAIYPMFLKRLFVDAFTLGLREPRARVGNTRWQEALLRLRDGIFYCSNCNVELFLEEPAPGSSAAPVMCWNCAHAPRLPLRLKFAWNDPPVVLNSNTILTAHHTDELARWDLSTATAAVQPSTFDPKLWGLKNLSTHAWRIRLPDGTETEAAPERSVALRPGTTIVFDAGAPRAKSATITQ
jgi:hypothetical protein